MLCDELKEYTNPTYGSSYYDIDEVKAAIAELKEFAEDACLERDDNQTAIDELLKEIESLKASHYAESVDAGMRERRLRRALWLARANSARNSYLKWNLFANFESEEKLFTIDEYDETPGATDGRVLQTYTGWVKIWENVERKCRAKAEEYK